MPNENNQIQFETNPSFLDSNKKVLFNINWDLNTGGVRQLEIDAFKCLNSNINAVYTNPSLVGSPIDGTPTKSNVTLFFARKRMIQLIDIWNRVLNCGLFLISKYPNGALYPETKMVGANIPHPLTEYLFKNDFPTISTTLDFKTDFIFNNLIKFITACINNFNNFKTNNIGNQNFFDLITYSSAGYNAIKTFININYNPDNSNFISLMNKLINIVKDVIDETKLANTLLFNFINMDFGTQEGRTNLLALDAYKSNYKALAKIDISYLNDDTKLLCQEWIDTNSNKLTLLYPQFGTLISRNTENETWNFRNVAIDTAPYNPLDLNPTLDPSLKPYQTRYLLCSQLDMKRPLVFNTQFINWANENDRPYVMLYNGGTLVYIPDEVKELINPITIIQKSINNGTFSINNNYTVLPNMPVGTNSIEFTLKTDGTTYSNDWGRKIIGPSSAIATYLNGIDITGGNYNQINWVNPDGTKRVDFVENGNYKNQTIKIKLENTSTGSNIYKDGILVASKTEKFDFSVVWSLGSTDANRRATGVTIENLTYNYQEGNILGEAPDNQLNLSAYFWKIGTSNNLDPNYNNTDDIKLKLPDGKNLYDIDKLDFLDNLTIYLKLN